MIQGNDDTIQDHFDLISQSGDVNVGGVVGGTHLLGDLTAHAYGGVNFEYAVTIDGDLIVDGDVIIKASGKVTFKGDVRVGSGGSLNILGSQSIVFDPASGGVVLSGVNNDNEPGDVVFESDAWTIPAGVTVDGSGQLYLRPATVAMDINIGHSADLNAQNGWNLSFESLDSFVGAFTGLFLGHADDGGALSEAGALTLIGQSQGAFPMDLDVTLFGRFVSVDGSGAAEWVFGRSLSLNAYDTLDVNAGIQTTRDLQLSSKNGSVNQRQGSLIVGGNAFLDTHAGMELVQANVTGRVEAVNRGTGGIDFTVVGTSGIDLHQLGDGLVTVSVPAGSLVVDQIVSNGEVVVTVPDGDLQGDADAGTVQLDAETLQLLVNGSAGSFDMPIRMNVGTLVLNGVPNAQSLVALTNQQSLEVQGAGRLGSVWMDVMGDLRLSGSFELTGDFGVSSNDGLEISSNAFVQLLGSATASVESRSGSVTFAEGSQWTSQNGDVLIEAKEGIRINGILNASADIGLIAHEGAVETDVQQIGGNIHAAGLLLQTDLGGGNDQTLSTQIENLAASIRTGALSIMELDDLVVGNVFVDVATWNDLNPGTDQIALTGIVAETVDIHGPVQTVTQSIALKEGWNQIALGVNTGNRTVSELFAGHLDQIDQIIAGDRMFDPKLPEFLNTLDTFNIGEGVWIQANVAVDQIDISGEEISSADLMLNAGWNFVGLPIMDSRSLAETGSSLSHWESVIQITDGNRNFLRDVPAFLNTLTEFGAGQAYWIYVEAPTQWQLGRDAGTFQPAPNGLISLDVSGDLTINKMLNTHGDVILKANSVSSTAGGQDVVLSGRHLWLETALGFGGSQAPMTTDLLSLSGSFGGEGLFVSDLS